MTSLHNEPNSMKSDQMEDNNDAQGNVAQQYVDGDEEWRNYLEEKFVVIKYIARGSYGRIFKIQEKSSNSFYAMKVTSRVDKKKSIQDKLQKLREKDIMENMGVHPFVVTLYSSFSTSLHIVLIMSYIDGISLADYIDGLEECFVPERDAAFYIAEISLALHFLHKNGIIHRDIKMNNIMLDADGHVKLIDFGGSKDGLGFGVTTHTFICNDFTAAPEMLKELCEYTFAVDWYALGILIGMMLTSDHPFISLANKSEEDITFEDYQNMLSAIQKKEMNLKKEVSTEAFSLLEGLLEPDPEKRLGSHDSADKMEIKHHVFLNEIDWAMLEEKKVKPPYISSN